MSAADAVALLRQRGWTLSLAESLTGGALTSAFVEVPGVSDTLNGGIVAYATPLKELLLSVPHALLEAHGPVHREVALAMAEGARAATAVGGVDHAVGVSTTGIAGPDSPDGQPVGTVHIAVVTPAARYVSSHRFVGDRAEIRAQTVATAVTELVRVLRE